MANITINEISQNYSYNIGSSSYAQIALPITACWGPGYFDPNSYGVDKETMLEKTIWQSFPANQDGLESFVRMYRGAGSNYRTFQDYSYHMAMTLLTSGYDVLVCRVSSGSRAQCTFDMDDDMKLNILAKYPGTFGNSLQIVLSKVKNVLMKHDYWNIIVYIVDASGVKTAVENKVFVFDIENSTSAIPHYTEIESDFFEIPSIPEGLDENSLFSYTGVSEMLVGGADIVPMATSETYDSAYAELTKLNVSLPDLAAEFNKYQEDVDTCTSHISKLDQDLTAYNNKLAEVNKHDPVDTVVKDQLEEKIDEVTASKAKWEASKTTAQTNLTAAETKLNEAKTSIADKKSILADESYKFRVSMIDCALNHAKVRYGVSDTDSDLSYPDYITAIASVDAKAVDNTFCLKLMNQEWVYTAAWDVYELLKDKLSYKPNRIISPGWDDQNIEDITGNPIDRLNEISPLHIKLMDVAYYSRCGASYLDIPKCLPRAAVYNESTKDHEIGYAQMLARYVPDNAQNEVNGSLYSTHSALFAPWTKYRYVGINKERTASPSFAALLIQRAMILNQSKQYEWLLPDSRKHSLSFGRLDYAVPKKLLDIWQRIEGVGINVITQIPDMGLSLWGNSTLYEVPPATYQALANLSTRHLVNAVENVVYRAGISITFKYNNSDAYSSFVAAVTPILDTMKNAGAIEGSYIRMSADINGLDQVNANSVIGKIYLQINGVINDISIDLIALPPNVDLDQFKA